MNKKQLVITILLAFFIGAIGSIVTGRFLIPYLADSFGWQSLNRLATSSPIVINRTQEVQLNEGVNLVDLAKQAGNITVSIYSTETNPSFLGNGIIMTSDGLIFTSKTIVGSKQQLSVVLNNGSVFKALVRAVDPKSDIAAVTIEEKNLSLPAFADSIGLEIGQRVLVIGESNVPLVRSFAQGFITNTVLNTTTQAWRTYSTEVLEDSFETDAQVNNGRFIGSPIINLNGKLIGMVAGSTVQKIVVAENLQSALNAYLSTGKITRPKLGLTYFHLSKSLAAIRGFDRAGILVAKADEGSPVVGQLLPNDLIIAVDGQSLENQSFEQIIQRHSISEIKFRLVRAGKEMEISINLVPTK